MKTVNLLFLLTMSVVLSNCSYKPYQVLKKNDLTQIPTPPHNRNIDVYHEGDSIEQDFLAVRRMEVQQGRDKSYQDLVNLLKFKAKLLGLDAVIIGDYEETEYTEESTMTILEAILVITGDYEYETTYEDVYYQTLYATGIKYRTRIDYLDRCVYTKMVWKQDSTGRSKVATVRLNPVGKIVEIEGEKKHWEEFHSYSIEHLVYETQHPWSWRNLSAQNKKRWLRRYTINARMRKIDVRFKNQKQLDFLNIKESKTAPYVETLKKEQLRVFYEKGSNRISHTKLYNKKKQLIRSEEYFYDQEGRILQRQVFQFKDKKKTLDKTIVYDYYQNSDLDYLFTTSNQK